MWYTHRHFRHSDRFRDRVRAQCPSMGMITLWTMIALAFGIVAVVTVSCLVSLFS